MSEADLILICQSDAVNYEAYSALPVDRMDLYRKLIFPRMVHYKGGFCSHLDLLNHARHGVSFSGASYGQRRDMFNIWNLLAMNGAYLANYLLGTGLKVKIVNNVDAEWDLFCGTYEAAVRKPLIGISTTFYLSYVEIKRIVKRIRDKYPDAEILVGGAFINEQSINEGAASFERPMRKLGLNYLLYAFSSEVDLKELLLARKNGRDILGVNNCVCFKGNDPKAGEFLCTKEQWNCPVLDDLPALWDQVELPFKTSMIQMRTSCGCPFSCAFCSYPKTARQFDTMSVGVLEKHIQSALRIPGVRRIIFIDDTFNVPPARFKDVCRMLSRYDLEWFSFLRVQFIDQETAALMKASGCKGVYLGLESANDVVLTNMNKRSTAAQFKRGLGYLSEQGITSVANFIIGFPGETARTIEDNINFIETAGIDFYTLKEFYYMKHTDIYAQREHFGLEGSGASWRHNTMDHDTAHQHKLRMINTIKRSVFIDPDVSLWYVAYLYDQGFSMDLIRSVQQEINRVMFAQMNSEPCDPEAMMAVLRSKLQDAAVKS